MFSAGAESLLRQAREIPDEELKKFCSRVSKLLQKEDVGPEAIDALQRLFLIVSATKYSRRLEQTCVDLLQTTLCSPACPEQLQLLCAAILRERSPCDSLRLSCDHVQNVRQLSLVASVLLAQGDKQQEVRSVGQHVFRVLESRQPEGPSPRPLLPVVTKVIGLAPGALQEAGPCHRGGRGGGHRFLHGAVHGPALHRGPVAERAGLLHAAGVAAAQRPPGWPRRARHRRQVGAGGLHPVRALGRLHRQPPAAPPGAAAGEGL